MQYTQSFPYGLLYLRGQFQCASSCRGTEQSESRRGSRRISWRQPDHYVKIGIQARVAGRPLRRRLSITIARGIIIGVVSNTALRRASPDAIFEHCEANPAPMHFPDDENETTLCVALSKEGAATGHAAGDKPQSISACSSWAVHIPQHILRHADSSDD